METNETNRQNNMSNNNNNNNNNIHHNSHPPFFKTKKFILSIDIVIEIALLLYHSTDILAREIIVEKQVCMKLKI